ncbi:methionine ABC transporter ATP-binding protein [Alkalihalobacillus macyae]|uniref:methionine ABC transporter ATP-binding protein n=1 Tax=Guptibacillus hwajinpoensis TaxID=208199 RepID=UPI00273BA148|nr:methionine ABC transporter ATP-binding protein [Alkalihalobacillus macyae]MDP4552540.1 methionine ABC transporter ATP-binding protein [Alkalihalobacillus macyae]
MIRLENITKTYKSGGTVTKAVDSVSIQVEKGSIYGVIGYSGAGKSTLVRMVNLLERPTDGKVFINDIELTSLSTSKLQKTRQRIGMIFQSFNLLKTGTVYQNIAIPLKLTGVPKKEIEARVDKYLEIVGLSDKHEAYPSELSGGQKQRVAIARALAHEPEVLLCDEATSALDPDTTESILTLLEQINRDFGITILLITHEMHVVQKICHEVAVMENGKVIEQGRVVDIFSKPETKTSKRFVQSLFQDELPESLVSRLKERGQIVNLSFIGESSGSPALALVSKKFDVYPSILAGNITQLKDQPFGRLVVHLDGEAEETAQAVAFLEGNGVVVEGYVQEVEAHVG